LKILSIAFAILVVSCIIYFQIDRRETNLGRSSIMTQSEGRETLSFDDDKNEMSASAMRQQSDSLNQLFEPYEETLIEFATNHNLLIDKYYHGSSTWSLCFEHPSGGNAKITLSIDKQGSAFLRSIWWQDDFAALSRKIKTSTSKTLSQPKLAQLLDDELILVAGWIEADLDEKHELPKYPGKELTKHEFDAMNPIWPKVIL